MVKIVSLGVLFQQTKRSAVRMLNGVNHMIRFRKIDLVIVSNDLALRLSFETHLDDIPGLIVKKTMRVP